jgi:hypothetical protein
MAEAAPALKRELALRDVTLFAMACVTSARWIAPAGHNGPGSVVLWLLTGLLFMVPLSVVVSQRGNLLHELRPAYVGPIGGKVG